MVDTTEGSKDSALTILATTLMKISAGVVVVWLFFWGLTMYVGVLAGKLPSPTPSQELYYFYGPLGFAFSSAYVAFALLGADFCEKKRFALASHSIMVLFGYLVAVYAPSSYILVVFLVWMVGFIVGPSILEGVWTSGFNMGVREGKEWE